MSGCSDLMPGDVRWHTTDAEHPEPDVGFELQLANGSKLWAGEITRNRWVEAGADAMDLGGDFGFWIILYNRDQDGKERTTVVGKAVDRESAETMIDAISAAIRAARRRR